ncbi:uncharacterized protein LOC119448301 [Dermacentor silvarum]|uniref:uncharacterized protein LOC119448301 n=1 Tax=Dermacentor silvarum TaxID=543639 RepID=UPI0021009F53|nr:uncharacterized protein LOC119448301 [Dermacentor silvarum]
MRFTLAMLAVLASFSEISTRRSFFARALRPVRRTPLNPLQRARLSLRRAYGGYGTGLSYVPGTTYGVGAHGIYPTGGGGGYGYVDGLGYNRFGYPGGPSHNVLQFANVAPPGPTNRFDFTQRSIAGFFNTNDPARPFGVNFNTLRVSG